MHLMGRGRYARETYPAGAPQTFGIPNEILRYYFQIDSTTVGGTTYTARPWTASAPALVTSDPPPDLFVVTPVPPCSLADAALNIVTVNDAGNITGDDILIQWRGILGNNPVLAIPAPPLGAQQDFIPTNTVGALPSGTITISNFNFNDVVVPKGGATILPDLAMPENLVVPEGSSFFCFFAVGINWNRSLINAPFGP